jgi:hypothetical protein
MAMPMRGELPTRVLAADGRTEVTLAAWDKILGLKNDTDLIVVSVFSVIGLAVALIMALAFPLSEGLPTYLAYAS